MEAMTIAQALAITAEVCGSAMSDVAAQVMAADLDAYPRDAVLKALVRCRREGKGRLSLASIIERIDDGWPDPDVALGVAFKCAEGDAAQIVCDEIMAAWGDADPALEAGDRVAFRTAFLSSYKRRRDEARAEGRSQRNWVSGSEGREDVIRNGVASGLLPRAMLEQLPEQLSGRGAEIAKLIGPALELTDEF